MKKQKSFPFKIGADPEFSIILQDRAISAQKLMQTIFKGGEHKEASMGYTIGTAGDIGWDGMSATGELRPMPTTSPQKLTENLTKLILAFATKTQLFELSTKSDKMPVGGHLHFELTEMQKQDYHAGGRKLEKINKAVSVFYLPIMIGEDMVNLKIRTNQSYGKLGDYHTNSFKDGEEMTYEFRVPTGEWLTTAKIAKATIAYLATVYHEITNNPDNIKNCEDFLYQNKKQGQTLQDLTMTHYVPLIEMLMKKIKKQIKTFEFYPEYKEEIDFIMSPAKVMKEKKEVNFDMIKGWNLEINKQPTKRELLSEKKVKQESLKNNVERLAELINIPYNDDMNVIDFARAIKYRIITLNWKPNNTYYLYGLKQGIEDYIITNRIREFLIGDTQIKTTSDLSTIKDILIRMEQRLIVPTNAPIEKQKTQILIGIPFKERVELNKKKLIEIIYNIEKGKHQPKTIEDSKLENDYEKANNDKGKIWKIANNIDQYEASQMIHAEGGEYRRIVNQARSDVRPQD